ncbi:hypothetical protein E2P81_ATG01915 [Venturia nashicola]|nr:hypothetical protein E2P81_ATG01915 [Venturia nashicola]
MHTNNDAISTEFLMLTRSSNKPGNDAKLKDDTRWKLRWKRVTGAKNGRWKNGLLMKMFSPKEITNASVRADDEDAVILAQWIIPVAEYWLLISLNPA